MRPMRAVADTNVVVSGLLWYGPSRQVLDLARSGEIKLFTSALDPVILADPDDDAVLACAMASGADLIISGDSHLRDLREFRGIRVVSAAEVLTSRKG